MLINTQTSPYAKAYPLAQENFNWTDGFWKKRFDDCLDITIPHILNQFEDPNIFHSIENFRIAAGDTQGEFAGTVYGDGDFYKLLEGAMYHVAKRGDKDWEKRIDDYIDLISRAQLPDGYISTKQIISEKYGSGNIRMKDIDDFEVYNFGHLFTSACNYKRITGKDNFLKVAIKAAGYLDKMYHEAAASGEVKTAVCPSHYMGLVELYRVTGDKKYLELAELALNLRDSVKDGTDDNQDRLPLREHRKILGHAVRSTYLYAGVADLYAETGEEALKTMLDSVYQNLVDKKIYINGGCGAIYNGMSPYGYFIGDQKVHQAFGYEYQLPNVTAYNETCGALGDIFWNLRMFAVDPQAKYFDMIERSMLNLALAAISMDGDKYFYENMLRRTKKLDYEVIWPLERVHTIKKCFCCPTNLSRCIAEAMEYTYMLSKDAVWMGMYGASEARFDLENGAKFTMVQSTDYPWDGLIRFTFKDVENNTPFKLKLRVPGWVESGYISVNGKKTVLTRKNASTYFEVEIAPQDAQVEMQLDMPVRYTVAHPMVEETVNQVAVERGPLVYCIESPDAQVESIDDLYLLSDAEYATVPYEIKDRTVIALETQAAVLDREENDRGALYQTLKVNGFHTVPLRLIPYFAWDNRGYGEMRIWTPILYRF